MRIIEWSPGCPDWVLAPRVSADTEGMGESFLGEFDRVLAEAPLLAGLSRSEIASVERVGRVVDCATGQALCPLTDSDHRLFLLVEGRVALHLAMRSGEHCGGEREVVLERAGDVLGWTLLMKPERLTALAHCTEPSRAAGGGPGAIARRHGADAGEETRLAPLRAATALGSVPVWVGPARAG